MMKVDLREKPSTYVVGKGIIIAVILFTSSLGFILGYFVGRATTKETQVIRLIGGGSEDITKLPSVVTPSYKYQPQVTENTNEKGTPDKVYENANESLKSDQKYSRSIKILYTVQIGAFKNLSDAEKLKIKFEKKGFKSFVTDIKSKNGEKLYRVWVGEFATRKEAEEVSSKIKKNEGLQPFVTFKKGE